MRLAPAVVVALVVGLYPPAWGQDAGLPRQYATTVAIRGSDPKAGLPTRLRSCISTELRKLDGVILTDADDASWSIYLIALNTETMGGKPLGFAMAWIVQRNLVTPDFIAFMTNRLLGVDIREHSEWDQYESSFQGTGRLVEAVIRTGSAADIESTCKDSVSSFDVQHLEPERLQIQRFLRERGPPDQ